SDTGSQSSVALLPRPGVSEGRCRGTGPGGRGRAAACQPARLRWTLAGTPGVAQLPASQGSCVVSSCLPARRPLSRGPSPMAAAGAPAAHSFPLSFFLILRSQNLGPQRKNWRVAARLIIISPCPTTTTGGCDQTVMVAG